MVIVWRYNLVVVGASGHSRKKNRKTRASRKLNLTQRIDRHSKRLHTLQPIFSMREKKKRTFNDLLNLSIVKNILFQNNFSSKTLSPSLRRLISLHKFEFLISLLAPLSTITSRKAFSDLIADFIPFSCRSATQHNLYLYRFCRLCCVHHRPVFFSAFFFVFRARCSLAGPPLSTVCF